MGHFGGFFERLPPAGFQRSVVEDDFGNAFVGPRAGLAQAVDDAAADDDRLPIGQRGVDGGEKRDVQDRLDEGGVVLFAGGDRDAQIQGMRRYSSLTSVARPATSAAINSAG